MKVLVFAPHPDDEVLGVGGTIINRVKNGDEVYVCIATKGFTPPFQESVITAGRREARAANDILGTKEISFLDLRG